MEDHKFIIIIDGAKFEDKSEFYNHIQALFTNDLDWNIGPNLDAFHDILQGGFGKFAIHEPIKIIWINYKRSEEVLGTAYIEKLLSIIKEQKHISLALVD